MGAQVPVTAGLQVQVPLLKGHLVSLRLLLFARTLLPGPPTQVPTRAPGLAQCGEGNPGSRYARPGSNSLTYTDQLGAI